MKDQYFSKIYRGFLVQQTSTGWVVPQLPTWSKGPVSQGPYSTYQIACHVLDRVLEEQDRGLSSQSNASKPSTKEVETEYSSSGMTKNQAIIYLILIVLFFMFPKQFILTIDFVIGGSIHLIFEVIRILGKIGQMILS
jgi:hypothetical protein